MRDQATFVTIDNIVNGWRQKVLFFLDTTIWGRLWDVMDFVFNVAICIVYIVNTTVVDSSGDPSRIPMANRLLEFILAVVFLGQYILRYVVINANHRALEHVIVFFAFVAPMIAYFRSIHDENMRNSYMSAGVMAIFYPARFLRLHYAVNRLVAMGASTTGFIRLTLIRQEVISLCSDIVVAILFFASLVHSCINWYSQANKVQYEGFSFLDAIYSIVKFFNADHGPNIFKTTIVILHTDEPSMEMKALLRDPTYANRVFYVKGRATSIRALKHARVDLATCVYILTRKTSHGSGIEEDAETMLIALALNAFNAPFRQEPSKLQVYAQTILPNSIAHLTYLQTSRIACVDELRLGIMAQNCATPGFAALIFMLSTSMAGHVNWDYSGIFTEEIASSADDGWVKSYIHGMSQEIYQAHVPSSLTGKSFFKAARYFYRCHGMLVFGVGSLSNKKSPHSQLAHHPQITRNSYYQVMLAPRNYTLQPSDMLFAIALDVQTVLNSVMYAERVSIKSTRVPYRSLRKNSRASSHESSSPLRFVARSHTHVPKPNYISDSDSSYFTSARNNTDENNSSSRHPATKVCATQVPQHISNHIVVCDGSPDFPRSMPLLVQALRDAYEDDDLVVVILCPGQPDTQQSYELGSLTNVFAVQGTPLSQPDLRRTIITRAQRAIVLSSASESNGDSAAVLANMNIQQLCGGQFFVTTELLNIENIRYLDHTQLLGEPLFKRTFMGGHIFMPAVIDTMLCQCYFSSHILDVMRHLTFSHDSRGSFQDGESVVTTPRACEAIAIRGSRPGHLSLLYVPQRFVGRRYDTLVLTLMKQHGAVALGLYRIVSYNAQSFAAVMCNPLPSTSLVNSDAVYVLGPDIAGWTHVTEQQQQRIASTVSPGASKVDQGTGSSQSRHTVYSHNTVCTPENEHSRGSVPETPRDPTANLYEYASFSLERQQQGSNADNTSV
ncbi:hypothetical protein IWW40_003479 [Coemansia sp. RSA 1250]|nr:hypothetical protein IWW40_003479 [Coemansia sp. RSA 1250]